MQKQPLQLQDFNMLSLIGVGNYAKVVLVRKKSSGKLYAMKIIKKRKNQLQKDGKFLQNQAYLQKQILFKCQHPFIIKIHGTFQHHKKCYFVMQYCQGGQLFGLLKRNSRLSQQSTKFYAAQILLALQYLHQLNFIYRDLKPQNVLIDKQGYIKLIDFGLSCYKSSKKQQILTKIAGTPEYLPPEIFSRKQSLTTSSDWWSFGSLIFQLIVGFPPFYKQNQSMGQMKQKIIKDQKFLNYINNPILKDLIQKLLNKDPQDRLGSRSSRQIKTHPWFSNVSWQKLIKKQFIPPFIPELKTQQDTKWFDLQNEYTFTPPQNSNQLQKNPTQKYSSFSLSWKSSKSKNSPISPPMQENASPVEEIQIKIQENLDVLKIDF